MKKIRRKTLSMFSLAVLFSLVMILISFTLYYYIYSSSLKEHFILQVEVSSVETANSVSSEINERFNTLNSLITSMNSTIDIYGYTNTDNLDQYFSSFDSQSYNIQYTITDLDGIIVYNYPTDDTLLGFDESHKNYFEQSTNLDTVYWSEPYVSNITGEDEITIGVKGTDHYIFAHLGFDYINNVYTQIITQQSKELLVIDAYGIIIYDSLTDNDDIHMPFSSFDEYKFFPLKTIYNFDYNNNSYVGTKDIVNTNDWSLILYQDSKVLTEYTRLIENRLILLNMTLLFIVVLMISIGSFVFSKKLRGFFVGLKNISYGNETLEFEGSRIRLLDNLSKELNKTKNSIIIYNRTIREIAYIDTLTSLHNREGLKMKFDSLDKDIKRYLIKINITRFALYNESYGYDFGNSILKVVSDIITERKLDDCIFGRLESDKFLLITKYNPNDVISNINELFETDIEVLKIKSNISLTYTVIEYPKDGDSFDDLVMHLMQTAHMRQNKKQKIMMFEGDYSSYFERQIEIELSLEKSLVNRDFDVAFQPIVLKDKPNIIRGFEALARWNHSSLNQISPAEFIPILEKTGKVHRLDYLIISNAIKMISKLSKENNADYVLSCNVSVETILDEQFISFILDTQKRYKFNPRYLEIEITESTIIKDPEKVISVINELTSHGIRFSQDDFGDGYSSLNYLTTLNISTLKLSKNLIDNITKGYNNKLLVNTIIELAHELGFEVIVEGVETEETLKILNDFNCDYIQGYYFHKPMSYDKLKKILGKNK